MKSIILYPEKDRYVLKRIFKIYNSQGLKVDACTVDTTWSLDYLGTLSSILDNYSHVFIILSKENFEDHWLINIIGYLKGSRKEAFFYFTENDGSYKKVFSKFPTGQDYEDVISYAKEESIRWTNIKREEEAKESLINRGFALSPEAMAECVSSGQLDIVKDYVDAGFSPSIRNKKGVPILCLAVRNKFHEITKYLIDIGADINSVSEDRNNTPVMDAAANGDLDAVKLFVNEGADLEVQSKNGQTALILAVGDGNIEISTLLLQAGADFEAKDFLGMSAKSYANLFKKEEILKYMV